MASDFIMWLQEIISSFDGSDIFAFFAGCLAMVVWKNIQAMRWNRSKSSGGDGSVMGTEDSSTEGKQVRGRKISLPKMNRKYLIWIVVIVSMVGIMWSTTETATSTQQNTEKMTALAIRLCEGSKVTRVENKGLQDLFFAALNVPPEIAALPQDDPKRKAWGQDIGLKYLGTLDDAGQQRDKIQLGQKIDPNFWERYFGPDKPEPLCNL